MIHALERMVSGAVSHSFLFVLQKGGQVVVLSPSLCPTPLNPKFFCVEDDSTTAVFVLESFSLLFHLWSYRFQNSSSCPKFRIKAHQHTQAFGWEQMQMSACLKRRGEGCNATAADRAIEPALDITLQLHQHFPLEKALCFSIAVSWEVWSHEQWENAFCCLSLRGSRTEVTCSFPFYNERTQLCLAGRDNSQDAFHDGSLLVSGKGNTVLVIFFC